MGNNHFNDDDDFSVKASRKQKLAKKNQKQPRNHSWVDDLDEDELDSLDKMGVDIKGLK